MIDKKEHVFNYLQQLHILFPQHDSYIQGSAAVDIILKNCISSENVSVITEILPEYLIKRLGKAKIKGYDYNMWSIPLADDLTVNLYAFTTYIYNQYPYISLFKTNIDTILVNKDGCYSDVFNNIDNFLKRKIIYISGKLNGNDINNIQTLVNQYDFKIESESFAEYERSKIN